MCLKKLKNYLKILKQYPVDKKWFLKNRYQLENFLKNNPLKESKLQRSADSLFNKLKNTMKIKYAIPAIAGIIILALGGTGFAAQNSLPNDTLYPVKIAIEKVELAISSLGGNHKAEIKLKHALKRLEEVQALIEEHQKDGVIEEEEENEEMEASETLEEQTEEAIKASDEEENIDKKARIIEKLERLTERHQEVLQRVYDKVPEQAKNAIEHAMEMSEKGHLRAIEALQKTHVNKEKGEGNKEEADENEIECETSITCEEGYEPVDTGEEDEQGCPIRECIPAENTE